VAARLKGNNRSKTFNNQQLNDSIGDMSQCIGLMLIAMTVMNSIEIVEVRASGGRSQCSSITFDQMFSKFDSVGLEPPTFRMARRCISTKPKSSVYNN